MDYTKKIFIQKFKKGLSKEASSRNNSPPLLKNR